MTSMPAQDRIVVDGVGVALGAVGLLLRGPSGSGRSDLALRLIDEGARLIADEQVEIARNGPHLTIGALPALAPRLKGRIEARGLGLVPVPYTYSAMPLGWVVDLVAADALERMPGAKTVDYLGIKVPLLELYPFHASATAKLRLAARCGPDLVMGRE
jgi:HPr kinase/phosphorylase